MGDRLGGFAPATALALSTRPNSVRDVLAVARRFCRTVLVRPPGSTRLANEMHSAAAAQRVQRERRLSENARGATAASSRGLCTRHNSRRLKLFTLGIISKEEKEECRRRRRRHAHFASSPPAGAAMLD